MDGRYFGGRPPKPSGGQRTYGRRRSHSLTPTIPYISTALRRRGVLIANTLAIACVDGRATQWGMRKWADPRESCVSSRRVDRAACR